MNTLYLKKFLASLMAVLVLLTSLSVCLVSAETEGDFEYEVWTEYDEDWNETEYVAITGYTGTASELTIPAEIQGLPVYEIDSSAFEDNTTLKKVTIPDSVSSIGGWAFYGCTALETVVLSKNLEKIDTDTFALCTSLTSVTIPDSVKVIESGAFSDCTSLADINLPEDIEEIGYDILFNTAFYNTESNWENSLLYLDNYLVSGSYDITGDITIKDGTTLVANMVFFSSDITSVTFPKSMKYIGRSAFAFCENLTKVELPEGVAALYDWVFEGCLNLTEVKLPSTLEVLGDYCFSQCEKLTTINLPDSLTAISISAFGDCVMLEDVKLPANLKEIHYDAFTNTAIKSIHIPAGVEIIEDGAFGYCTSLTAITVDSNNQCFFAENDIIFERSAYSDENFTLITYPAGKTDTSYTVPDTVLGISSSAFAGNKNLKEVTVGENTYLISFAFAGAYGLESINVADSNEFYSSVDGMLFNEDGTALECYPAGRSDEVATVPENTKTVNMYAFFKNNSIKEVVLPEGLEIIDYAAFVWCEELKTLRVPSTVTEISDSFAEFCYNLTSIYYNGTMEEWKAYGLSYYNFEQNENGVYIYCTDGTIEAVAPNGGDETDTTESSQPVESTPAETTPTTPAESTPATSTSTDPTETLPDDTEYELGDANMDKKLNIRDATLIQKHLAKITTLDETALALSDFTQDGKVNIKDATNIQKRIAGII